MESANAKYVRAFADAWNGGDAVAFLENVDPSFEWVAAREQVGSVGTGAEGALRYLAEWLELMPDLKVEVEELIEDGDRVLSVLRMSGTGAGSGATTEVRMATVTTFRDGRPLRTEEFLDPDEARSGFGDQ